MKANCVNVLNRTVNEVCLLENNVNTNTNDIEFLFKYMDFNKKLQLSNLGCNVKICSCVTTYCLQNCFVKDQLLYFFLVGILDYLNSLNKENYFFVAKSEKDIPSIWRNHYYSFPSVIQIGLIECDNCILTNIIDSTKSQNFNPISPVISYLEKNYCNLPSYTLAFLQFLAKQPDINLYKCFQQSISQTQICQAYEELINVKKQNKELLCCFIKEYSICFKTSNIISSVIYYINKATNVVNFEYKQKSFNDPFYPKPTTEQVLIKARDLFLENNNLDIDNCGRLIDAEPGEPGEPGEPYEPSEPSEPSDYKILVKNNYDDDTNYNLNTITVEEKIKSLLELTETESELN